jgi:hypothetical protein
MTTDYSILPRFRNRAATTFFCSAPE